MHYLKKLIYILGIGSGIWACSTIQLDIERSTVVSTGNLSDSSATSLQIVGTITDLVEPIANHGHTWSSSPRPSIDSNQVTSLGLKTERGEFISIVSNLAPARVYYFRGYAEVNGEIIYGQEKTFRTLSAIKPDAPLNVGIQNVSQNTAQLLARIDRINQDGIQQHGHCWILKSHNADILPTIDDPGKTQLGQFVVPGQFLSQAQGLMQDTTYVVRAYASNTGGVEYSDVFEFRTIAN